MLVHQFNELINVAVWTTRFNAKVKTRMCSTSIMHDCAATNVQSRCIRGLVKVTGTHMCGGSFTTSSIISAISSSVNNSLISQPVLSNTRAMIFCRVAVVAGTCCRRENQLMTKTSSVPYPCAILSVDINWKLQDEKRKRGWVIAKITSVKMPTPQ